MNVGGEETKEYISIIKNIAMFILVYTHNVWLRYRLVKVIKVGQMLVNQEMMDQFLAARLSFD